MQLREAKTTNMHTYQAPTSRPGPRCPALQDLGQGPAPGAQVCLLILRCIRKAPGTAGPGPAAGHVQTDSPFSGHTALRPCCSLTGTTWEFGSDTGKHFKERRLRGGPSRKRFPLRHEPRRELGLEKPCRSPRVETHIPDPRSHPIGQLSPAPSPPCLPPCSRGNLHLTLSTYTGTGRVLTV